MQSSKEHHSKLESGHSQAMTEIKVLKEEKDHLQAMIQQLLSDKDQLHREKKMVEEEKIQLDEAVRKASVELQLAKDEKGKLRQVLFESNQELKDKLAIMDIQV